MKGAGAGPEARSSFRAAVLSPFVGQRLRPVSSVERQGDLLVLKDAIEAGKVTPVITTTHPLDEAAALRDADEGHGRGKIVIAIGATPMPTRRWGARPS